MKTLAIIWICVLLSGACSVVYINGALNAGAIQQSDVQFQPAGTLDLGNNTCLQACNPTQFQPAQPIKQ